MTLVGETLSARVSACRIDTKIGGTEWYRARGGDKRRRQCRCSPSASALLEGRGPTRRRTEGAHRRNCSKSPPPRDTPPRTTTSPWPCSRPGRTAGPDQRAVACLRVAANAGVGDAHVCAGDALRSMGRGLAQDEQQGRRVDGQGSRQPGRSPAKWNMRSCCSTATANAQGRAGRRQVSLLPARGREGQSRSRRTASLKPLSVPGAASRRDSCRRPAAWHLAARAQGPADDDQLDPPAMSGLTPAAAAPAPRRLAARPNRRPRP